MSRHPEVLWAQRSDKLYLTICLPDAKNVEVKCEPDGKFSFSAIGLNSELFKLEMQLFGKINPEVSKIDIGRRNIFCTFQKDEIGWWKRLLKSDEKPAPYIKVDWNKWCDEDEEPPLKLDALDRSNVLRSKEAYDNTSDEDIADDDGLLYIPDLENAKDQ